MLSAVPFRADNVLFVIVFGATQQSITTELSKLDTSSLGIVFIHITEMPLEDLASTIRNEVSSLGFGPHHGYVRPHPCGPCPTFFAPGDDNDDNYLWTICCAVTDYLKFTPHRSRNFMINLTETLGVLISYAGSRGQASPDLLVQQSTNGQRFRPVQHLKTKYQTYAELILLIQTAADKRQEELRLAKDVLHDEDDTESPISCFTCTNEFVPWVEGWIWPQFNVLSVKEICSPISETAGPRESLSSPIRGIEGRDLASKKRKLDVAHYSSSFYGGGDGTGDVQVLE